MTDKTSLGDRMKVYENAFKAALPIRMPVIIRVDGKAFHTYTKPLKQAEKPFDPALEEVMNLTAIKLCEEIQGAQIAYVQSDEISILVHNYKKLNSQSWFGNELQKMVSVSAGIASATFTLNSYKIWSKPDGSFQAADLDDFKPAYFDSRAFILPEPEVCNYFIWRQQDCTRNSVQSLARSLFSHKKCNNKNSSQLQDMCVSVGRNWNDEPTSFKRGRCIVKKQEYSNPVSNGDGWSYRVPSGRWNWLVDNEIPIFTQDRDYIDKLLIVDEV